MGRGLDGASGRPWVRQRPSSSHRPCGDQGGDPLSPTGARLEGLRLRPGSESLEGPGPEGAEPVGPADTSQSSLGPAEAWEAEEQVKAESPGSGLHLCLLPVRPVGLVGPARGEPAPLTRTLGGLRDPACSGPAAEGSRTKAVGAGQEDLGPRQGRQLLQHVPAVGQARSEGDSHPSPHSSDGFVLSPRNVSSPGPRARRP